MLTSVSVQNLQTTTSISLMGDDYPLTKFFWDSGTSGAALKKFQYPGNWDNFKAATGMPVTIEGDILGDDYSNYWTLRKALLAIFVPHIDNTLDNHVKLTIVLSDGGTQYYADCTVDSWSIPIEALQPSVTPFRFQLTCNHGYWRNVSGGATAYI
jgi:hypothetical protein